jgi:hypothetical protein
MAISKKPPAKRRLPKVGEEIMIRAKVARTSADPANPDRDKITVWIPGYPSPVTITAGDLKLDEQ